MVLVLYMMEISPPCRAVLMTIKQLGLQVELREENLVIGNSKKHSEFLKINPRSCVPTIDDDGFYLWESRAIMTYLVNKHSPNNSLYPKDPKKRALVDMMLNFDQGTLYRSQVEYLICPLLTIPAIDDNGFYLWDSHVIMAYLVNKYGNDSPLYPKVPKERAVVDRMLYFDVGTLYASIFSGYVRPQVFEGLPPDPEKKQVVIKNLELLEQLIHETTYMAGDHITVADYSIIGSLSYAEEIGDISLQSYPKILTWMQRMRKEVPNFEEIVRIPLKDYKEVVKSRKQ